MLTSRGWWFLVVVLAVTALGVLRGLPTLAVLGLTLLLWFLGEWLLFAVRRRVTVRKLHVFRELRTERGPVDTLWAGQTFEVQVELRVEGGGKLPYVSVSDRVPFGAEHIAGETERDGQLRRDQGLRLTYSVRCPAVGRIRFEGLRVQLADLQGFFHHAAFVRGVVLYRVLPVMASTAGQSASIKRHNLLPPPGIHRLHQAGSGSELLDLRDYLPGDPPKTIAWKVSARRDRLITKEFESEVPLRCTLFLDTSSSVRIPSPVDSRGKRRTQDEERRAPRSANTWKPLDQLVEVAAGVVRSSLA